MPDGSLWVVNQQGRDLIGYGPDRNPIGVIARSDKELEGRGKCHSGRGRQSLSRSQLG